MGLEGQTHLEDAVAQQDQAHGADEGENEIRQFLHDGQGIVGGEGGDSQGGHSQQEAGGESIEALGPASEPASKIIREPSAAVPG